MVLIYFGQQGELFEVDASVFIQSTIAWNKKKDKLT